jgi:hypothetical protein
MYRHPHAGHGTILYDSTVAAVLGWFVGRSV